MLAVSLCFQEYIRIGDTLDPEVASLTPPQAEAELKVLGAKISQVRGEIGALHEDSHKKISRHDLDAALQRLGKTFPPKQLEVSNQPKESLLLESSFSIPWFGLLIFCLWCSVCGGLVVVYYLGGGRELGWLCGLGRVPEDLFT